MRICKVCRVEKFLKEYTCYKNYATKHRHVCRECVNKQMREKTEKIKEELNQLKEKEEIIREFDNLKSAADGYDVSWSGEDTIIFNKAENVVHAKNATKEMYNLIFARYCIEIEKKLIESNIMKDNKK